MQIRFSAVLLAVILFFSTSASARVAVELKGSPASMERQHSVAVEKGLRFAKTFEDIDLMLEDGELVRLPGNEHYELRDGLSSDAARAEVRLFVERLAEEYFEATGEKLVVTSLTRAAGHQPANAHSLSVHPTGLALDLRISQRAESRKWIEKRLLELEAKGVLDATRENHPPHYHIALFPREYREYVAGIIGEEALAAALSGEAAVEEAAHEQEVYALNQADMSLRGPIWNFFSRLFGRGR
jgi:hypothetical protein